MHIPEINQRKTGPRQTGGFPRYGDWNGVRFVYVYKRRGYKAARLICEAFHGSPPSESSVCMHIDENARNNVPSNLKWGTQKENLNAPGFIAYCKNRTGENSPRTKWHKSKSF